MGEANVQPPDGGLVLPRRRATPTSLVACSGPEDPRMGAAADAVATAAWAAPRRPEDRSTGTAAAGAEAMAAAATSPHDPLEPDAGPRQASKGAPSSRISRLQPSLQLDRAARWTWTDLSGPAPSDPQHSLSRERAQTPSNPFPPPTREAPVAPANENPKASTAQRGRPQPAPQPTWPRHPRRHTTSSHGGSPCKNRRQAGSPNPLGRRASQQGTASREAVGPGGGRV